MKRIYLLTITMVCSLFAFSFTSSQHETPEELLNKRWVLTSVYGEDIEKLEKEIFIHFKADGNVKGFSGCGNFSGGYTIKEKSLHIEDIEVRDDVICNENDVQKKFLSALQQANDFYVSGEELQLFKSGQMIATFNAVYLQ